MVALSLMRDLAMPKKEENSSSAPFNSTRGLSFEHHASVKKRGLSFIAFFCDNAHKIREDPLDP